MQSQVNDLYFLKDYVNTTLKYNCINAREDVREILSLGMRKSRDICDTM